MTDAEILSIAKEHDRGSPFPGDTSVVVAGGHLLDFAEDVLEANGYAKNALSHDGIMALAQKTDSEAEEGFCMMADGVLVVFARAVLDAARETVKG